MDWQKIKEEYVTTRASQRALAEKYGASPASVGRRASKEGWLAARGRYQKGKAEGLFLTATDPGDKTTAGAPEFSVEETGEDSCQESWTDNPSGETQKKAMPGRVAFAAEPGKLSSLYAAADSVTRLIAAVAARAEREETDGGDGRMDTKTIRELTMSMKDLTAVVRNLYGLPTVQEQASMEIATQKLQLELQKAAGLSLDEADSGVVILAPIADEEGDGEP